MKQEELYKEPLNYGLTIRITWVYLVHSLSGSIPQITNDVIVIAPATASHILASEQFIESRQALILDCFGMSRERMLFLGNLVSQGIKNYFRYQRPKTYYPLALYIDECHNFINPNLFDVLKEGRKFLLGCLLSTQDFALLGEKLSRIMLNVGNLLCFRVGFKEAALVAREMRMKTEELQFLPKYHLAYKTLDGVGVLKAPRPPVVKPLEPVPVKQPVDQGWKGWFPLEPLRSSAK